MLKFAANILVSLLHHHLRYYHRKISTMLYPFCAEYPQHNSRSHYHNLQYVGNVRDDNDSLTSKLNFIKNNKDKTNSFNKNASKSQQKTSLCASTTQSLTTISTKTLPLILPFSYKKAIINTCLSITTSSLTSTSTALTATNNLISPSFSPISSQNNSCHKLLFTSSYKSSFNMFNNNAPYEKSMASKHLPRKYKFIKRLIVLFLFIIMQIGFATADQGKFYKRKCIYEDIFSFDYTLFCNIYTSKILL